MKAPDLGRSQGENTPSKKNTRGKAIRGRGGKNSLGPKNARLKFKNALRGGQPEILERGKTISEKKKGPAPFPARKRRKKNWKHNICLERSEERRRVKPGRVRP